MKDKYQKAVLECVFQYMDRASTLETSPISYLKLCWGSKWIKEESVNKLLLVPSSVKRDTYNTKRVLGMDALLNFMDLLDKSKQIPLVWNKEFSVPLEDTDDSIIIKGSWDIIFEVESNNQTCIKIVKVLPESNRFITKMSIRRNLEITLMYYAFTRMFSTKKPIVLSVFDLETNKEWITERNENDVSILRETVKNVIYCINRNISLLSPDKRCYHCDIRHLCGSVIENRSKIKSVRRKKIKS